MHPALATPAAQAALEHYLHCATLGLGPEQAQEVRDELEEHALGLVDRYALLGHAPEDALRRALADLGSPWRVSAAMNGVHNMPKLIAFGTLGLLAVSAGMYALAGGFLRETVVELPALSETPQPPTCTRRAVPASPLVTVVSRREGMTCFTFRNQGAFIGLSDIQRAYAAGGFKTRLNAEGDLRVTFPNGEWRALSPQFRVNGQGYTSANMLIVGTERRALTPELKVWGYDNPLLSFGPLKLRLGTEKQPVAGSNFYLSLLGTLIGVLTTRDLEKGWESSWQGVNHFGPGAAIQPSVTVQTGLKAGEVVMLVTRARHQPPNGKASYFADIAPTGTDGTVKLFTEGQPLVFVGDVNRLSASDGQNRAVLVRVTGVDLRDLKSGIFIPKS